jgi:hypothetical protein
MERAVMPAPARSEPAGEAVAGSRLPLGWALLLPVLAWWPSYLVPRPTLLTVRDDDAAGRVTQLAGQAGPELVLGVSGEG